MLTHINRTIKLIISLFVFIFDCISGWLQALFNKSRTTYIILYYHAVYPEEKEAFARQMDDLLRWTKPIELDEIDALNTYGRHCSVTFDDGFVCVPENALPEMAKRNIPATMFVPSACFGRQPQWLDEARTDHKNIVMTIEQLKSLDNKLVVIGSHGRNHFNLLQIDIEEAKKEIFQSKRELEEALNTPIETISFPHGDFNQGHVNMAIQAGYKNAYSILPEPIHSGADGFIRGRVKVDPFDWRIEFRLKLLGAYRWQPYISRLKKLLCQYISSDNNGENNGRR